MLLRAIKRHGVAGTTKRALRLIARKSGWEKFLLRNAEEYKNPTVDELKRIESDLHGLGISISDYFVDRNNFQDFVESRPFPEDYHGGPMSGVWEEKHLEHFVAAQLLNINNYGTGDVYVDIAACHSPWAFFLRTKHGVEAYAIDLAIDKAYSELPYYIQENATATHFTNSAVRGASLHCAFEMFVGDDDTSFICEAARVLRPGGKIVIIPLYMHTHYCAYSTPEYWRKGYSDPLAFEYVRKNCYGVRSSRKYDASKLKSRVLDPAIEYGLNYRIHALRNRNELGKGIYCHFILELYR